MLIIFHSILTPLRVLGSFIPVNPILISLTVIGSYISVNPILTSLRVIRSFFFFLVRQMVSPLFTTKVAVRCRSSRLP